MSAATASIADVSRTAHPNKDGRNNSVHSQAQCAPVPLPALGTQKIIQGNGTNVGTVISLQCPDKHRLIGGDLTCVMGPNSTHWEGQTYCKPLSPYEDYGFRVAVLASIVSSAIIFLMSAAFITCCLLDCIKEDKRKEQERESDMWQWEEQAQSQEENRSRYSHKGRNNNNNNAQEKMLWDSSDPAVSDSRRACSRCQQQYGYNPACAFGPTPPLAALPGHDYDQPLSPHVQDCDPPRYPGPPLAGSPGLIQISAVGNVVWQYGGQRDGLAQGSTPAEDELSARNKNPKEFSIRIISV
ncbi:uncharacterized protein susd3 isoform X1 [Salarias fasciatus]|uniref:uncharacterized protein susd3 isoform X1 n=1 Tax=Salarias fasciatus TaxID=181472 RepID=UPI001176F669|nr:uncharacterized protein LOC115408072 isoform X1 [Salarias fasciatus]